MPSRIRKWQFAFLVLIAGMSGISCASNQTPPAPPVPQAPQAPQVVDAADELGWPRTHVKDGNTVQIFQPQIATWTGNVLEAQSAVAITPNGKTEPEYGVVWLTAKTEVDKTTRLVTLEDVKVTRVSFPENKNSESGYMEMLKAVTPETVIDVPLDHLEANLAIAAAGKKAATVDVKNDPPRIIFSSKPAIMIMIDGEPVLRAVVGTQAMRVVNTRSLILLNGSTSEYYLYLMNHWVVGKSAEGPWTVTTAVPAGFDGIRDSLAKEGTVDLMVPGNPAGAPKDLPTIYTTTSPSELIQSRGAPDYTPIPGTKLLYMKNTENAIFMMLGTERFYLLVSGRWFTSSSLEGPWAFVPGSSLPPDFAKIPPDNAKANVLCSVPGTPQAEEAVIANSIPQTATVNIFQTSLTVSYDGTPKFAAIEGAGGLEYATNSATPVIQVDAENTYFAVNNGVWFHGASPLGPWIVATGIPPIIYTIPVSSPIHYVTYVRIYAATPEVVYVGYTPGYMGTCVSSEGVVVYGTGYYYPAYVGAVWYGYPPTYGYGAGFACGMATGFAFGFAAGAIIGDCWSHPYWGPCRGFGSVDINTHSVYTNWHGGVTSVNRHYEYNAYSGKSLAQGSGRSFNPYTGRASAGGYSSYIDRSSGDFNAKAGGATYNPDTGVISGHGAKASGNFYDGNANVQSGGFKYNTRTDSGVGYKNGDVYASNDGNVYRHTDSGWQSHSSGGWQDASNSAFSEQRQNLDQQRFSRQLGEQRFQGFRSFGGFGGGFGGRR